MLDLSQQLDKRRPGNPPYGMSYYSQRLSGERLRQVYEIAPPRVLQYLQAEIDFVRSFLAGHESVLELGCGYGRVMLHLAPHCAHLVGIDTARESLQIGRRQLARHVNCDVAEMDALHLGFADRSFDLVLCIQNGICAFRVDQSQLIRETIRVLADGGIALFSTYSPHFWPERLHWFELQAQHGLLGPIDYAQTGNGVIACTDGFRSGALTVDELLGLCGRLRVAAEVTEVGNSSLFCIIRKS